MINERTPQTVRRKYLGPIRRLGDQELAVRLPVQGRDWHFLLGTERPAVAQRRIAELLKAAQGGALATLDQRASREFTLAVDWFDLPRTCTYTTLCTNPALHAPPPPPPTATPTIKLGLLEPEAALREALRFWLGRIPGFNPVDLGQGPAIRELRTGIELVLCNAASPYVDFLALREAWRRAAPEVPVLGYSILPSSDDVFSQMSGGHRGYFLRRRQPAEILEPLGLPLEPLPRAADLLQQRVRRYFEDLFSLAETAAPRHTTPYHLTPRELDVLSALQRGLQDKEIASAIGISPQTVHTHLKRIFEKLGAHTRTEAVMKFLQK
ncbi:MAG TPA: response regulator transcription factor [Candidatus Limnocylindria bacterium]|nr:response regulator transcription factor [Candidatus Limnocylindria bacterium]